MNFQLRHLTVLRLSGNGYKRPFFKRKIYILKRTRSGSVFRGRGKRKPKKTNEKWHRISILKTINMPYFEKASKPVDRNSINDILAEKKRNLRPRPIFRKYGKQERPVNSETPLYRNPLNTPVYNEQSFVQTKSSYFFSKINPLKKDKENYLLSRVTYRQPHFTDTFYLSTVYGWISYKWKPNRNGWPFKDSV